MVELGQSNKVVARQGQGRNGKWGGCVKSCHVELVVLCCCVSPGLVNFMYTEF